MPFVEDLAPYKHPMYGVISNNVPDPSSPLGQGCDNYHLFTAHALRLATRLGEAESGLLLTHIDFIFRCMSDSPGLRRFPTSTGDLSYDELEGAAYTIWRGNYGALKEAFKSYLKEHKWFFDIQADRDPKVKRRLMYYYGFPRNIAFQPFFKKCIGLKVGIVGQSLWSLGLLLSLFSKRGETSGKILCDLQIHTMGNMSPITRFAVLLWTAMMSRKYSGRRDLYQIYFPGHPIANHQRDDWE